MRARAPKGGITVNGKFYRGGQFLPKIAIPEVSPEEQILTTLASFSPCISYARSMHRYLSGYSTLADKQRIHGQRIEAIRVLRDGSETEKAYRFWADRYAKEIQIFSLTQAN